MSQSLAISESIATVAEAEAKFGLSEQFNLQFFKEWLEELPTLTAAEQAALDRIRNRYLFYRKQGLLSERTTEIAVVTPLLDLSGLYDPPFIVRTEEPVKIELADQDEIYQGRIDVLVVQNQFWVLVVEEKRGSFNSSVALPQTLAYMSANPHADRSTFALVTNGEDYQFVKLKSRQYALSKKFTLMSPQDNELYFVLRVLKRIGGAIEY